MPCRSWSNRFTFEVWYGPNDSFWLISSPCLPFTSSSSAIVVFSEENAGLTSVQLAVAIANNRKIDLFIFLIFLTGRGTLKM
jgi:hypothetical protein